MPAETLRATYTDWAAVRGLADGTDLGAASSTRDVGSFLERAYDQDLVSASAVADSTYAMNEQYGFSPVDAAWEMYGQSREGAVVVMAMTDEVDLDGVERNLRASATRPRPRAPEPAAPGRGRPTSSPRSTLAHAGAAERGGAARRARGAPLRQHLLRLVRGVRGDRLRGEPRGRHRGHRGAGGAGRRAGVGDACTPPTSPARR